MKIKDINEDIIAILISDYLETGWDYIYWGKQFFTNKKTTIEKFLQKVSKELLVEDYEVPVEMEEEFIPGITYVACLYMDKHDGDSYGVMIMKNSEAIKKVKEHITEFKKLLGELK